MVSLSTALFTDTRTAVAHFGVYGTDNKAYQRTGMMKIAGGGFAPNSTVFLNVQSGGQPLSGFPVNVQTGLRGDFGQRPKPIADFGVAALAHGGLAGERLRRRVHRD